MSFGSNGVHPVLSLQNFPTQLRLVNFGVNGASSASFASTFNSNETVRNAAKHEFWVQWSGPGAFVAKFFDVTSFSELVR
jgi:hypothetical protein